MSPIKNMARTVVNDVELRGETLHAGDQVILMYPSANRDADEFPDPFTFDVRRDPNHHIAFGFGPHYCLGQALARLELNVMFDVLFRRLPDLEPAGDEPLPYRRADVDAAPALHPDPLGHPGVERRGELLGGSADPPRPGARHLQHVLRADRAAGFVVGAPGDGDEAVRHEVASLAPRTRETARGQLGVEPTDVSRRGRRGATGACGAPPRLRPAGHRGRRPAPPRGRAAPRR